MVKLDKTNVEHKSLIIANLQQRDYLLEDAKSMFKSQPAWYGIVDGAHRWLAALQLQEDNVDGFEKFKWTVSLLPNVSFQTLCLLARYQNELNNPVLNVSVTLFDQIKELQSDLHFLRSEVTSGTVTAAELCRYFAVKWTRIPTNAKYGAQLAVILHSDVVEALGEIINLEDITLARVKSNAVNNGSIVDITVDCRAFRRLFTVNNLRREKRWKSAPVTKEGVVDLKKALYRVKYVSISAGAKTTRAEGIDEMFDKAKRARMEVENFTIFLVIQTGRKE